MCSGQQDGPPVCRKRVSTRTALNLACARFVVEAVSSFSVLTHFDAISNGVIDLRDIIFFASLIAVALAANALVIDLRKAA